MTKRLTLNDLQFLKESVDDLYNLTLNHLDISLPVEDLYKYPFTPEHGQERLAEVLWGRRVYLILDKIIKELRNAKEKNFEMLGRVEILLSKNFEVQQSNG